MINSYSFIQLLNYLVIAAKIAVHYLFSYWLGRVLNCIFVGR